MKYLKLCFAASIIFVLAFVGATKTRADGGIFVPTDFSGYETGQRAFIYFANQSETLVVSANFRGDAKDFSWVVPVPAKPEIDKADSSLFTTLERITRPVSTSTSFSLGAATSDLAPQSNSVQVVEQKQVGIYDTAILKATDENALSAWLNAHGYSFPTDKNSELKNYVDNDWYFTIAKIQTELENDPSTNRQLAKGTLTPLKLTFSSDKIIYPMKLTGIALRFVQPSATATASAGATIPPGAISETVSLDMPIELYILSDNKVNADALKTEYGNYLNETNIKNLNTDLGSSLMPADQKLFLTKLTATLSANTISDDFTLINASDNQIYPKPVNKTTEFWLTNLLFLVLVPLAIIFFPVPLGLIFTVFVILQTYVKKKWLYIVGSIYQILFCLTLVIIGLVIVSGNSSDISGLFLENGFIGGIIALLVTLVFGIYVTVKMFKHYKITFKSK
ncbi:MAG: DUF2330 domain-containing protein [Candidatus Berkelbacteria bacterium]|nr:DUF2330 domain-containing protein [Candidatus Berkelbacteria bacterium]